MWVSSVFKTDLWCCVSKSSAVTLLDMFVMNSTNDKWRHMRVICICKLQGWGQFHFFNSIPIPIPVFSIPIPIPLLTISFNSNSNSNYGDFNSNSNSNSRDFKSRQSQFQKWPVDVFHEIDYNYTNNIHIRLLLSIPSVSYPLFNGYKYMASWLILYQ